MPVLRPSGGPSGLALTVSLVGDSGAAHRCESGRDGAAGEYVTAAESQSSPASGDGDRDLLLPGDESEGIRGEGHTAWEAPEILVRFAPDCGPQCPHRLFTGTGSRPARDGADAPLRTLSDDGCRHAPGRLPLTSGWGHTRPCRGKSGIREGQRTIIVVRHRERGDHDVAFQLRIGVDDAHRQHRRSLIEEPVRCESCRGQCQHTVRGLQADPLVRDSRRTSDEGQDIFGGLGVCEEELVGHTL